MKKTVLIGFLIFFVVQISAFTISEAAAQQYPWNQGSRVSYFYDRLMPYGDWIYIGTYGWCWYPYNVSIDWRPYTNGYWSYTNDGWLWVSNYPWGWACFHYGRWFYDDTYGWLWYPDTIWAPAWCAWRYGGDWIGWAPLPPQAIWTIGIGLNFTDRDCDRYIPRHGFSFVRRKEFLDRDIGHHAAAFAHYDSIFKDTHNYVKNMVIENNHVLNRLPIQNEIQTAMGRRIKRYQITEASSPHGLEESGREVKVFRPEKLRSLRQRAETQFAAPGQSINQVPPEIRTRHQAETQAFKSERSRGLQALQGRHRSELQNVPSGSTRQEIQRRQENEVHMFQNETNRQGRLLQNWQQHESRMNSMPQGLSRRHFNMSFGHEGEEKAQGTQEHGERFEHMERQEGHRR